MLITHGRSYESGVGASYPCCNRLSDSLLLMFKTVVSLNYSIFFFGKKLLNANDYRRINPDKTRSAETNRVLMIPAGKRNIVLRA